MKVEEAFLEMQDYVDSLHKITVRSSIPAPIQLRRLFDAVKTLEDNIDYPTVPKSTLDAEKVWAKWVKLNYDFSLLDNREQRSLCVDPRTALRSELITSLIAHPESFRRASTFNGLVAAYFSNWRSFEEPDRLERFLITNIRSYNIKRERKYFSTWIEFAGLFSADADKLIAKRMISKKISVQDACKDLYISPGSDIARSAEEKALKLAVENLINQPSTVSNIDTISQLNWIIETLMPISLTAIHFRQAMEKLILSNLGSRLEEAKKMILHATTNDPRLGDPRLRGSEANWRNVSNVVKEKILSWLAGENIDFFFNAVTGDSRRAKFWLDYAMKPGNIKDFQVALCTYDEKLIGKRGLENITFSRLLNVKTSAFMMQFTGYDGVQYVIVEFSQTGNAAYIYKKDKFDTIRMSYGKESSNRMSFRNESFYLHQLKQPEATIHRILHYNDWEHDAKTFLYEIGIKA